MFYVSTESWFVGQELRVTELQLDAATHDRQPVATRKTDTLTKATD